MKLKIIVMPIVAAAMALASGCSNSKTHEGIETDLTQAEAALALGDMEVATSVGDHLFGDNELKGLNMQQLVRLSLVYVRLAEMSDQSENIDKALAIYRHAYNVNPDSAEICYGAVAPEQMADVVMLSTLSSQMDFVPDENDLPVDSNLMDASDIVSTGETPV